MASQRKDWSQERRNVGVGKDTLLYPVGLHVTLSISIQVYFRNCRAPPRSTVRLMVCYGSCSPVLTAPPPLACTTGLRVSPSQWFYLGDCLQKTPVWFCLVKWQRWRTVPSLPLICRDGSNDRISSSISVRPWIMAQRKWEMTRISRPQGDSFNRLFETTGCRGHEKPSIKKKKKWMRRGGVFEVIP